MALLSCSMTTDRQRVLDRIDKVESELKEVSIFETFAASSEAQYRMAKAERDGLVREKEQLYKLLGEIERDEV